MEARSREADAMEKELQTLQQQLKLTRQRVDFQNVEANEKEIHETRSENQNLKVNCLISPSPSPSPSPSQNFNTLQKALTENSKRLETLERSYQELRVESQIHKEEVESLS